MCVEFRTVEPKCRSTLAGADGGIPGIQVWCSCCVWQSEVAVVSAATEVAVFEAIAAAAAAETAAAGAAAVAAAVAVAVAIALHWHWHRH